MSPPDSPTSVNLLPLTLSFVAATAIIAGSLATAGYLDAKFHLRNDIEMLYANYKAQQDYIEAGNCHNITAYAFL